MKTLPKRTVRQNRWGNWRGYEGRKFVREFASDSRTEAGFSTHKPLAALDWLAARRIVIEVRDGDARVVVPCPGVEVTIINVRGEIGTYY